MRGAAGNSGDKSERVQKVSEMTREMWENPDLHDVKQALLDAGWQYVTIESRHATPCLAHPEGKRTGYSITVFRKWPRRGRLATRSYAIRAYELETGLLPVILVERFEREWASFVNRIRHHEMREHAQ